MDPYGYHDLLELKRLQAPLTDATFKKQYLSLAKRWRLGHMDRLPVPSLLMLVHVFEQTKTKSPRVKKAK